MLTTLFSLSFTSCIDDEVSPLVEAIYANQAELIAAQAAVQDAQAAYLLAQAQYEEARAAYEEARAAEVMAYVEAQLIQNEYDAERYAIMLLVQMSDAEEAMQVNQLAMEVAMAQHEALMIELLAEIEEAGIELAAEYAGYYDAAMTTANSLLSQKLTAEANLANAQLMLTGAPGSEVSYAYHLASLQSAVAVAQANVDNTQAQLDMLNDYVEDPNAAKVLLEAQKLDLQVQMAALEQQLVEQQQVINDLNDDVDDRDTFVTEFNARLTAHNNAVRAKNAKLEAIANNLVAIGNWETARDNWAGTLTTLQGDLQDALDDVDDAWAALGDDVAFNGYYNVDAAGVAIAAGGTLYTDGTLQGAYVNAKIAHLNATAARITAQGELSALQTIILGLEGSLNTAAANLAAHQALVDGGTLLTAKNNADNVVTNRETALSNAITRYELWRDRFEAYPNGGYHWEDTTSPSVVLGDNILGDFNTTSTSTAAGAQAAYVRVETWAYIDNAPAGAGPEDKYTPATLGTVQQASLGANEFAIAGNGLINTTLYLTAHPAVAATEEYFVEVGLDDEGYSNLAEFQAATRDLGNEDIFDNPPALPGNYPTTAVTYLGNGTTTGNDAYTNLYNAELAYLEAEWAYNNANTVLDQYQQAYDDLKAVYEDELNLLNQAQQAVTTAQGVENTAAGAETTAQGAVDTAWTALGAALGAPSAGAGAISPANTLYEVWYNAYLAVEDHEVCDEDCYQAMIDQALDDNIEYTEELVTLQMEIDENGALVEEYKPVLTAMGIEFEFVIVTQAMVDADTNYVPGTLVAGVPSATYEVGEGMFWVTNDTGSSSYNDLRAEIIQALNDKWAIETEKHILQDELDRVNALISALTTNYSTINGQITTLGGQLNGVGGYKEVLEKAQAALALAVNAEAAAAANIAYYQALVDTLEQQYQNALAEANEWKALMEAALQG